MKSTVITQTKPISVPQSALLLVLSAETALFGTLVMSYLFMRNGGSNLTFIHPKPLDFAITSVNTIIFLASAAFAWNSHRAIEHDRVGLSKTYLMVTLILGAIFFAGQVFEFRHSGMQITDSTFGAVFFALISFHALHVLAGITVLALNFARTLLGDFSARRHMAITVGTWFWYYVVAVWVVLFTVLYLV
jgi:cytochrome c oxidase subunit 3